MTQLKVSVKAAQDVKISKTLSEHVTLVQASDTRALEQISFSRSREIYIDWDLVIGEKKSDQKPYVSDPDEGMSYLRQELERLWGFPDGIKTNEMAYAAGRYISAIDPPAVGLSIPNGERTYVGMIKYNTEIAVPSEQGPFIDNLVEYELFWKYLNSVRSQNQPLTEMSFVDLAPALIYRQYRELLATQKLGDALALNADKLITKEFNEFPSIEELDQLTLGYQRMRSVQTDTEIKLERLRNRARDLGYYLALKAETITFPDGSKDELQPGDLYQPYLTEVRWVTTQFKRYLVRESGFFYSWSWVIQVPYLVQHSSRVVRYKKVIPDFDPWAEKERELTSEGFETFRFERIGQFYVTGNGESIDSIMSRCEIDPAFCNRCAVLIPIYEQSLITGEVLSRYIVIKRPRRGVDPIKLPKIFIEEDLLFSTHFQKVEVGELVESINLAPGEERDIIFEKTTLAEQETRRTATSISDLTESDRVDLSSEMEREVTSSSENVSTQNLSAKAGGSYGGFSGGVEGSTSSTLTTRQFARDLQKVANKASRSVTRQTRQEVKTESSSRTNVTTRSSTTINIQNINQGRTLNLLFFQLYNIYRLSLQLERMSFTVLSGREIIAGSGIILPEIFPLSELNKALERLMLDRLPLTPNTEKFPSNSDDPTSAKRAKKAYIEILLAALKNSLEEYEVGKSGSSGSVIIGNETPPDPSEPVEKQIQYFIRILNAVQYTGDDIKPPGPDDRDRTLVVGSPGLYLDANVGAKAATEPYSEKMRAVELIRKEAEVQEISARAEYNEAMARRLSKPTPGNVVKGEALNLKTLRLIFEFLPPKGKWRLYIAQTLALNFEINSDDLVQELKFNKDQNWLGQDATDIASIVHEETKQELTFLI